MAQRDQTDYCKQPECQKYFAKLSQKRRAHNCCGGMCEECFSKLEAWEANALRLQKPIYERCQNPYCGKVLTAPDRRLDGLCVACKIKELEAVEHANHESSGNVTGARYGPTDDTSPSYDNATRAREGD